MLPVMLVAFAVVVVLASVAVTGGRPSRLADVRLRHAWLALVALAVQVLVISVVPQGAPTLHAVAHVGTYGLLGAFAWANRAVPGVALVGFGGACNLAAIIANDGVMPASAQALARAGMTPDKGASYANSAAIDGPVPLAFLGDVFAVPASWPLANVFSAGDVVIVAGFAICVHVVGRSRLARVLAPLAA